MKFIRRSNIVHLNSSSPDVPRWHLQLSQDPERIASIFWGAGALVILTVLPMEHWTTFQRTYLIIAELFSIVVTYLRFTNPAWMPKKSHHVAVLIGIFGIGGLIWTTSNYSMNLSVLFIWIALAVALIYPLKTGIFYIGISGIVYAFVLYITHSAVPVERWVEIIGASTVAGGTVSLLVNELKSNSLQDPLTKLPNRRAWTLRIADDFSRARHTSLPLSVAMVDLDGLKEINDEFGHAAGDRLLKRLGSRWGSLMINGSLLARLGGDEFVILAPGSDAKGLQETVITLAQSTPDIQFSVGIATWDGIESYERLLARADEKMYHVKAKKSSDTPNLFGEFG